MPEEVIEPVTQEEPVAPNVGGGGETPPAEAPPAENIAIPEAYKERGWANKEFKSQDDLFKEIDELQSLKGKKSLPFDFENATEEQIEAHLSTTRPENFDSYNWGEEGSFSDTEKEFFGKMLVDSGVSPYVGNKMIEAAMNRQNELNESLFSAEGQETIFKESFGKDGDWKKIAGETAVSMKKNLNENDQKLMEGMPNEMLGLMYRLHQNTIKAYGINEGQDRGGGDSGSGSGEGLEAKRADLRKQMDAIKGKNGSHKQLQELNAKLAATYKNDPRLK
jgi:hypothetical protein